MMRFRKRIFSSCYYYLIVVLVLLCHCVNGQQRQDDVSVKENQQKQDECWKNEQQQECSNQQIRMDPRKKKDKKSKQEQQIQLAKQFSSLLTSSSSSSNTKNDWKKTLSQWTMYVDMNPDWIGTYIQTNWLEELHTRIMLLAPDAFWNVYRTKPSSDEVSILMSMMTNNGDSTSREEAFQLHRHRGLVSSLSYTFGSTVIPSIQHWISHATLHEEALKRISHYAPLIEVGAGTAYYSAILQQRGIDIQPYDLYNTTDENHFTHVFYTNVIQASCTQLFPKKESSSQHLDDYPNYKKTLLIIWPNNPDYIDNLQYAYGSKDDNIMAWDYTCLEAYIHAGGETVIFVGEREENIKLMKHAVKSNMKDSGMCATRQFQSMLKTYFSLQEQITIPTWWNVDDLTIWKRRSS